MVLMIYATWFPRFLGQPWLGAAAALTLILSASTSTAQSVSVNTYHNDTGRSGGNSSETALTSSGAACSSFRLLHQVSLYAAVDAQPLTVVGLSIHGAK